MANTWRKARLSEGKQHWVVRPERRAPTPAGVNSLSLSARAARLVDSARGNLNGMDALGEEQELENGQYCGKRSLWVMATSRVSSSA